MAVSTAGLRQRSDFMARVHAAWCSFPEKTFGLFIMEATGALDPEFMSDDELLEHVEAFAELHAPEGS